MGILKSKGKTKQIEDEKNRIETSHGKEKTSLLSKIESLENLVSQEKKLKISLKQELQRNETLLTQKEKSFQRELIARKDAQKAFDSLKEESQKKDNEKEDALTLLSLLQSKGRLLDFLMDDITSYDDTQVGSASRIVHEGCRGVLQEYFSIKPLVENEEGTKVALESEQANSLYKIIGTSGAEEAPKEGVLLHKGWKAESIKLPKNFAKKSEALAGLITPAEVEIH